MTPARRFETGGTPDVEVRRIGVSAAVVVLGSSQVQSELIEDLEAPTVHNRNSAPSSLSANTGRRYRASAVDPAPSRDCRRALTAARLRLARLSRMVTSEAATSSAPPCLADRLGRWKPLAPNQSRDHIRSSGRPQWQSTRSSSTAPHASFAKAGCSARDDRSAALRESSTHVAGHRVAGAAALRLNAASPFQLERGGPNLPCCGAERGRQPRSAPPAGGTVGRSGRDRA